MSEHLEMNVCLQEGVCAVFMGEGQIEIQSLVVIDNEDMYHHKAFVFHNGELVHESGHAHVLRMPPLLVGVGGLNG
jgi:hypothetical protein